MLVGRHMSKNPVTASPQDTLAVAQAKMLDGKFRRLPVVEGGKLVGILSDRDLREHKGHLEQTKVNVAMTENPITVTPLTTLEEATKLLLRHKIGGLPVVEEDRLVGIITTSDILQAFLDVTGASEEGTARVDLLLEEEGYDLNRATGIVTAAGGEILGVGTYQEKWQDRPVFYLRLRAPDPNYVAEALKEKGYKVLGLHL